MSITVGGATQLVQLDTGSADLALPSTACTNCIQHVDPHYDPTTSTPAGSLVPCGHSAGSPEEQFCGIGTRLNKEWSSNFSATCVQDGGTYGYLSYDYVTQYDTPSESAFCQCALCMSLPQPALCDISRAPARRTSQTA